MNYDCMVAEHVNRVRMVTTSLWFTRWHWRWEREDKGRHGDTLALNSDGCNYPKRMDNRLHSPGCTYIQASFGIIPYMYDKKTAENENSESSIKASSSPHPLGDPTCRQMSTSKKHLPQVVHTTTCIHVLATLCAS
jgi:hypothetical protein